MSDEEIASELRKIAGRENGIDEFCTNSSGTPVKYADSEDTVKKMAAVSRGMTVYTEEIARKAVQYVFEQHAPEIAQWIHSKKAALRITVQFIENCGYILNSTGERKDTRYIQVSFHKGIGYQTKYGFFISTVIPVIQ
jgi:hypothetical protein